MDDKVSLEPLVAHTKYTEFGGDTEYVRTSRTYAKKSVIYDFTHDLEAQISKLKLSLENWKEILLPLHSLLLWDKNWYPGAIAGGTTFLFLSMWMLDPSVLTAVSIIGLTATISDYLVPILASALFKPDSWNNEKEKAYHDLCSAIIVYKAKLSLSCSSFYSMRSTRPKMFYGYTIATLALLAWIGNIFNNFFLTYLLVTILCLTPGMEHHGLLHKYGNTVTQKISEYSRTKTDPKKEH